jgi:transcriptional regulator with XRE-family HTH domain
MPAIEGSIMALPTLRERLKAIRPLRGWTQVQAARECRTVKYMISSVERNPVHLLRTLEKVAQGYGHTLAELTEGIDLETNKPWRERLVQPTTHPRQGRLLQPGLGQVLEYARRAQGLRRAEMGRRLDTSQSTVTRVEQGVLLPSVPMLAAWAQLLNLSVDDIVAGRIVAK